MAETISSPVSYILNFDGLSGSGREITDLDQAKPLTGKDLVVSIDDPMHHIYFCKYVIETMLENDFFQDEEDYKQVANGCYLFSNGFLATKLLRCVFGNNSLMSMLTKDRKQMPLDTSMKKKLKKLNGL